MKLSGPACISALLLTSCYHYNNAEMRRRQLLEMYPVGKTTREDIQARFGDRNPELRATRPAAGWEAYPNPWVRSYTTKAEQRIHRKIPEVDRYFGADGLFSLCYCWFYFDSKHRLIDAEWQWSSD